MPTSFPGRPADWPHHLWMRLVRRGLPCGAEVAASRPECRAWVYVRPLGDSRYFVRYYEVERTRYTEACDSWDYTHLLLNRQLISLTGEVELKRVLEQWLEDLSRLGDPSLDASPL